MRWKKPDPRPPTYWNPWFAWWPVVIENTGETVWMEWIWRHVEHEYTPFKAVIRRGMEYHFKSCRYRDDIHWSGANLEHKN